MKINTWLRLLGPGILFAAAAIGVSHLVQATKAGAEYGMGLLWAIVIVHIVKYPFFLYGPKYAAATGESILDGFRRLGKPVLFAYFFINLMTMFTIQTAVGLVTAGLAQFFFGWTTDIFIWMAIVMGISATLLLLGKYNVLDKLMKIVVVLLTIATIVAVILSLSNTTQNIDFRQVIPRDTVGIVFLIALMGWMPAPLDVVVWQSLWAEEKKKEEESYDADQSVLDFNIGYTFTSILAISFMLLGAFVMYGSGEVFSGSAIKFSQQLVTLYSSQLGESAKIFIGVAALATMFSTTLTTLDASPRAMSKTVKLLFPHRDKNDYNIWLGILLIGTLIIVKFFISEMGLMIKIATIFSFLTAPLFAIFILILIKSEHTPKEARPSKFMTVYSMLGIIFLLGFSGYYLYSLM